MTDKLRKKKACKNAYLGYIFIPRKYVLRVCFESCVMGMISSLKYKCPPPLKNPQPLELLTAVQAMYLFIFSLFFIFRLHTAQKLPLWSVQPVTNIQTNKQTNQKVSSVSEVKRDTLLQQSIKKNKQTNK